MDPLPTTEQILTDAVAAFEAALGTRFSDGNTRHMNLIAHVQRTELVLALLRWAQQNGGDETMIDLMKQLIEAVYRSA